MRRFVLPGLVAISLAAGGCVQQVACAGENVNCYPVQAPTASVSPTATVKVP